jgi:hypothetical protein
MSYDHDWKVRQALKGYPEYAAQRKLVIFLLKLDVIDQMVVARTLGFMDSMYV